MFVILLVTQKKETNNFFKLRVCNWLLILVLSIARGWISFHLKKICISIMSLTARVLSVSVSRADYLIAFDFSNADVVSRKYIDTRLAAHVPPSRRHAGETEREKERENTISNARSGVTPVVELQSRERIVLSYPENLSFSFMKWFSNYLLIAIHIISYSIRFAEINFYHHVVPFSYLGWSKKNIPVLSQKKRYCSEFTNTNNLTQSRFSSHPCGSHPVLFRVDESGDKSNRTHTQAITGRNLYQRFRAATCTMFVSLHGYIADENGRNFKQSIDIHCGHSTGYPISLLFPV